MMEMGPLTGAIPRGLRTVLEHVSERCRSLGYKGYIVGGAVRDMLIGVEVSDIDVTVVGNVQRLFDGLNKAYGYKALFHPSFGTVTLKTMEDGGIDIATARRETYREPAALPEVFPSNLYDDLKRRDFSINSMAVSLEDYDFIDPFGGRRDLERGIIRVLHDKSFEDDPTRIMRGIRFEKRYGFRMDNKTEALMKASIAAGYPARLSSERVLTEMEYILMDPKLLAILNRMEETGLWQCLFGGTTISPSAYKRLKRVEAGPEGRLLFPVLVLMEDNGGEGLRRVFSRYSESYDRLERYRARERALGLPVNDRTLGPGMLFSLFSGVSKEILEYLALTADTTQYRKNVKEYLHSLMDFKFHINGEDLKALGIVPGPRYKGLLERARASIVESNTTGRRGQLEILKSVVKKGGN